MNKQNMQNFPSLYRVLLISFGLILFLFLFLFTTFATKIIFTRLEANIDSLLNRSLSLAWNEYENCYKKSTAVLSLITSLTSESKYDNFEGNEADDYYFDEKVLHVLGNQKNFDFWLIINNTGQVIASNVDSNNQIIQDLNALLEGSWKEGQSINTSEVYPIEQLYKLDPHLASLAQIQIQSTPTENDNYPSLAMFQIAAVPFKSSENIVLGALVAGHLLNNDNSIAENYSHQIPNSFLSISTRPSGVRIVANIQSHSHVKYIGSVQTEELIKTTVQGKRYVGQVRVEPTEIHFVASDPIYNLKGQVIGALTVGVPSQGLASLKKDTFIYIIISAIICLLVSLGVGSLLAKKLSGPIVTLGKVAKRISQEETINSKHISSLDPPPDIRIRELWYLYMCFSKMASSLYQKCIENEKYLEELTQERSELQRLTDQLQEINQSLENTVNEQTMELRKAVIELKVLNNLKSKFLANISHELRTPLNSIIGFSEMLEDEFFGDLNQTQKEYVKIIHNSAYHLLEIINDILDLSLIEQGRITLSKREISVAELIQSVVTIVHTQAENKNLNLTVETPCDLPIICLDPTRIKQVLYNLITNAVKFTPPKGSIIIDTYHTDRDIVITVSDTGIGIKPEDQLRIFDEFYQAESTYERKFEGVGLGLPLSKRLVELHNGRIELSSAVNCGTSVAIHLPYKS